MNFEGCPGSRTVDLRQNTGVKEQNVGEIQSQLRHWPIQLHLVSPSAPYYTGADVLLSADCVAYAAGGFHPNYLQGKSLAIACPKLDEGQDVYIEKIKALFDEARINTLTVMIMEVPCCGGLLNLVIQAARQAARKVPVKCMVVGLQGDIIQNEWVEI
jgi:hypothetical protein